LQIIWADGGYLGKLLQWVKQLRPYGKLKLQMCSGVIESKAFESSKRWL